MVIMPGYKSYFFNQQIIFFSHNKSANSTFSHISRTGTSLLELLLRQNCRDSTHSRGAASASMGVCSRTGAQSAIILSLLLYLPTRGCLVPLQNVKFFMIFRHIESLNACMKH